MKDDNNNPSKLKWVARSGVLVFILGCLSYLSAWIRGEFYWAVFGGLMWMSAVAQWALMYMEPRHLPEEQ